MTEIWHKVRGYLASGVALITCPCHLPLTLPLLLSLTAGTAVGVFLERNTGALFAISTALFVGGLALVFHWQGSEASGAGASCPPRPAKSGRPQQERPGQARIAKREEEGAS